jgi:hypothetical protein
LLLGIDWIKRNKIAIDWQDVAPHTVEPKTQEETFLSSENTLKFFIERNEINGHTANDCEILLTSN